MMSLTQAPGRQQTSLRGGSLLHIGPSVPLIDKSPSTKTHLFFLLLVVIIRGVGFSNPGNISGGERL